ncbi:MAG: hypothetical protein JO101_01150 [Candidatus Eremiobacteraeota bacterium]|nr:hypothetical protein [Candidatus Eremiobacteraeota bacterium]MBV8353898.1 hypothetical protein [Candidatus Eremiobacteraeota bacterium]
MSASTETPGLDAPPVDELAAQMAATLCMAGLAYLAKDDVDSATMACDLVGAVFGQIGSRLSTEDRASLGGLVTELRMEIVRKRGGP